MQITQKKQWKNITSKNKGRGNVSATAGGAGGIWGENTANFEYVEMRNEGTVSGTGSTNTNSGTLTINNGTYSAGEGSLYNITVWAHNGAHVVINDITIEGNHPINFSNFSAFLFF